MVSIVSVRTSVSIVSLKLRTYGRYYLKSRWNFGITLPPRIFTTTKKKTKLETKGIEKIKRNINRQEFFLGKKSLCDCKDSCT